MAADKKPIDEFAPAPSFLRRNWQILSLAFGNLLFVTAILLWKGPIAAKNKVIFEAEVVRAEKAYSTNSLAECRQITESLERQIWRDPSKAGLIYFLRGSSALRLAHVVPAEQIKPYQEEALSYLSATEKRFIPTKWALKCQESLGLALEIAARNEQAQKVLSDSLRQRRIVQSQLYRLSVQAALELRPRDNERLQALLDQWKKVPDLSPTDRDVSSSASRLLASEDFAELRKLLQKAVLEDEAVPEIDEMSWNEFRVQFDLAAGTPQAAESFLTTRKQENNNALAQILLSLQQLSLSSAPAASMAALEYGEQRLRLDVPSNIHNDALIRQARIYMDLENPVVARALLVQVVEPGQQRFNARYLLGLSHFREAKHWDELSLEQWQTIAPVIGTYRQFVDRWIAGISATDPRLTRVTRWRQNLADAISPSSLKRMLAAASYRKAAEKFEQLQEDQRNSDQAIVEKDYAASMLMTGIAYSQLREYDTADRVYENVINFFPKTDFSEAARFHRANSHRLSANPRTIADFKEACELIRKPYRNEFLPIETLRRIFTEGWQHYEQIGDHTAAMALAELYVPYSLPGDADELLATSALTRAGELETAPVPDGTPEAADSQSQSRKFYREAAANFEKAALAKENQPSFPDMIWQTALAYFRGQNFVKAAENFRLFIKLHGPGERDFLANLLLARSLMAKEQWPEAKQIMERVLTQYPSSPDRFEGRIRLAQCYIEQASLEAANPVKPAVAVADDASPPRDYFSAAEKLLERNTEGLGIDLEPTAAEWQESLFELARLLYLQGRFDEAIPRLREAIHRFPDSDRTMEAQFQLAEAFFRSVDKTAQLLEQEKTPQGQMVLQQDMSNRLKESLAEFRVLVSLLKTERGRALTPAREQLLQDATFRVADVLMELKDWPGAIDAYTTAANRYQDRPQCLAAYVAIANAYGKMNRPNDAKSTLRQARWVLKQLDEKSFAESALTKQQWNDRLDSLVGNL